MLIVIPSSSYADFGLLQSSVHDAWCREKGSTLETRFRYTPSDCLETFPFPVLGIDEEDNRLNDIGMRLNEVRISIMQESSQGLTKTYNRFHDSDETSADIQKLRELHVEMDQAVAAAYAWSDLDLDHGFHETKQGVRFTINEPARREVLQRLLKLNHERYDEEVKQGLHGKKGTAKKAAPKKKAASKPAKQETSLFDGENDE